MRGISWLIPLMLVGCSGAPLSPIEAERSSDVTGDAAERLERDAAPGPNQGCDYEAPFGSSPWIQDCWDGGLLVLSCPGQPVYDAYHIVGFDCADGG